MVYKTPHVHVDACHFVQIQLLEFFSKGLSIIKLHPIHSKGFLTYGEKLCAPRLKGKNGSI
jgi:hypothetical protein